MLSINPKPPHDLVTMECLPAWAVTPSGSFYELGVHFAGVLTIILAKNNRNTDSNNNNNNNKGSILAPLNLGNSHLGELVLASSKRLRRGQKARNGWPAGT